MKIANQEPIKSIMQPENKPAAETGKTAQETSKGVASVKSKFENRSGSKFC